jgi:hypothetical protein
MAPPFLFIPVWNTENRRLWSSNEILSLGPTLFLDQRDLVVVSSEYNNWGNQAVTGADANDFASANATTRPATGSVINGYAAPFFTASNPSGPLKYMQDVSGAWTTILSATTYSLFMVVSCSEQSGSSAIAYANPCLIGDTSQYVGLYWNNVVSSSGIQLYNWDVAEKSTTSIPVALGQPVIVEAYYLSGSKSEVRVNNYLTQSATVINTIGNTGGVLRVGLSAAAINQFHGGIANVLAFQKTLSADEKRGIRNYLANKYNIPLVNDGENANPDIAEMIGSACTLYLKPSHGITGSPITAWANRGSGTPGQSMGSVGGNAPAQSIQNGLIVPSFDGGAGAGADYLANGAWPWVSASGINQWEAMIVANACALSASGLYYLTPSLLSEGFGGHGIAIDVSGARAYTDATGVTVTPYTSGTITLEKTFLIHAYYDSAKITCRLNNNTTVSASKTGNLTSLTQGLRIGNNYSVQNAFNGKIMEVAIFNRVLTTSERSRCRAYLGTKWGVPF